MFVDEYWIWSMAIQNVNLATSASVGNIVCLLQCYSLVIKKVDWRIL